MIHVSRRLLAAATAALLGAPLLAIAPAHAADPVVLNLIGINDFHGRIDSNTVKFAGTVEQVRRAGGDANSLLISAGDNVSASLFASAVQGDLPTIDVLNALNLDASAAGNHELDQGADDLTGRLSNAADFPFLSANIFKADSTPLLDKYKIFTIDGVDVAVVGAITEETSALVSPAGIQGLTFADPTESINDTVDELEALPDAPDVIVASIHEGAPDGTKTYEQNVAASPVFKSIVENTDPRVDAIFMGHTHQAYAYDAPIPNSGGETRPVLQTGSYGSNVGNIQLTFDKDSGTVTSHTQANVARVSTPDADLVADYPRVATVKPIVDDALAFAAVKGNEPVGKQTADITTAFSGGARDDRASESTLGNLVADSLLASVKDAPAGADIGVTNPGGLRADLLYAGTGGTNGDGVITYAEANSVLPFVNNLSTVTLSGANFKQVLEQQWQRDAAGNVPSRAYLQLGISKNVSYTFDPARPEGDRITSITVDGAPYDPSASYKIAVPSFLTSGGDNFRAFTLGTSVDSGLVDYQAFIDYLGGNNPVSPDFARRAVQVDGLGAKYDAGDTVSLTLPAVDLTSKGGAPTTSVTATLLTESDEIDLGTFPASAGKADVSFTIPAGVTGSARVRIDGTPTGMSSILPPFEVAKAKAVAKVDAYAFPIVLEGSRALVGFSVRGKDGRPTGTVRVLDGDDVLGEESLRRGLGLIVADTRLLSAGRHTLTVSYEGDDTYAPADDQVRVTVLRFPGFHR
ncbi:bifunctional metallophosphatase/5'-nucleotidase [Aeromicrobium sp. A1-2]|uniref:5'-nucleotidase C-terminal domain-containing protein n=1 Tax=Aeromicrobium sp. A1-2 TaxID=2107713 RepID=UPI000E4A9FB4|nr:5'-nucleotidase C-terminal domain-containing protein [Aeromicrobium sp. A1-2]AXT84125.1 bifunctional metallophosphatase/5'-nucleotidase [Aeromicrobium sp. A1-2]